MMLLSILLLLLAIFGAPLFAVIAASALLGYQQGGIDLMAVVVEILGIAGMPFLSAIPLFTFAGYLLSESNAPHRLVRLTSAVLGWLPGGLALVEQLAADPVPNRQPPHDTPGQEALSVRGEGEPADINIAKGQAPHLLAGPCVPDAHRPVLMTPGCVPPVGGEAYCVPTRRARKDLPLLAGLGVPESNRPVQPARERQVAVG